ncbi:MAG TPA: DUF3006 domain-containing protein [Methylomusa anaerophila]|uniref:DUF3006 domain-containing protein n=1 Tax=Methylomusa anaerophila TaxID=1930071 RepID=A0A348AMJ7_9FIRM|nr:DUF3006 domain-containing protein [Methylomusa anaerophila]BBB92295.1 hypothetical protein MAMMFC1_02980 [Methylomusa anaerophila]HML90244.1 DUF3006 domain-containing protein [Methylomusa anaerophila]
MKLQAVIDRFESNKAVLLLVDKEDSVVIWPRHHLPEASEGDIIDIEIVINEDATRQAKAEADALLKQVLEKNNK